METKDVCTLVRLNTEEHEAILAGHSGDARGCH
jgi:hypothetical protein